MTLDVQEMLVNIAIETALCVVRGMCVHGVN